MSYHDPKTNMVHMVAQFNSMGQQHGETITYHAGTQQVRTREWWRNGLAHGETVWYHVTGKKQVIRWYENGLNIGEEIGYHDDSDSVQYRMWYLNGKHHGGAYCYGDHRNPRRPNDPAIDWIANDQFLSGKDARENGLNAQAQSQQAFVKFKLQWEQEKAEGYYN